MPQTDALVESGRSPVIIYNTFKNEHLDTSESFKYKTSHDKLTKHKVINAATHIYLPK